MTWFKLRTLHCQQVMLGGNCMMHLDEQQGDDALT